MCIKLKFDTERKAMEYAETYELTSVSKPKQEAYLCKECKKWHLSTANKKGKFRKLTKPLKDKIKELQSELEKTRGSSYYNIHKNQAKERNYLNIIESKNKKIVRLENNIVNLEGQIENQKKRIAKLKRKK